MSHLNNSWNGWLIIDKPYNMGSTQVVSRLKRALSPSKIGHAGTLDPLATGILPIAVGQATKLIPYVMDGRKIYEFQITWGAETDTDDQAGVICRTSDKRPSEADIKSILPEFLGRILQQPPACEIYGSPFLRQSGSVPVFRRRSAHIQRRWPPAMLLLLQP